MNMRLLTCALLSLAPLFAAQAVPTMETLVDFSGAVAPAKGTTPRGALVFGSDGKLYGSTETGGAASNNGTLYRISTAGVFENLADFAGAANGSKPAGNLVAAGANTFYGTTSVGGVDGKGTVYKLESGVLSTVYQFRAANSDTSGVTPTSPVIVTGSGLIIGTCAEGGQNNAGTIYSLDPLTGVLTTLVEFTGDTGAKLGRKPSGLIRGKDGSYYGTTEQGGAGTKGTVFRLTPAGAFATLVDFGTILPLTSTVAPDSPRAPLVQATDGLFYGTTAAGGLSGQGTTFKMTAAGAVTILNSFSGTTAGTLGEAPEAALIQGTDGLLYGTTRKGGGLNRGTIFRFTSAGAFTTLVEFSGNGAVNKGSDPRGPLVQDNDGNFYGTTSAAGANNAGIVYKLSGTLPVKSVVTTGAVLAKTGTTAKLSGTMNPRTTAATFWFEFGPDTGTPAVVYTTVAPVPSGTLAAGNVAVQVAAVLSGLTPNTLYHYRLVGANGGGITPGSDVSFTTDPHPQLTTQPNDLLVGIGSPFSFSVAATGVGPKFAWLKNGGASVSSLATYAIPAAALVHAGSYTAMVTEGVDKVFSRTAQLGVINRANSSIIVNQDADTILTLSSAGNGLSYRWLKDGNPVSNGVTPAGSTLSGATTAILKIEDAKGPDTGVYVCEVKMGALTLNSGNFSVTTRLRPVIVPPTLGPWTTNGLAYGTVTALNAPVTYFASGLPPGVAINPKTGELSGRPLAGGPYTPIFWASNLAGSGPPQNSTVTVIDAVGNSGGTFDGLIVRDAANNNLGGSINLVITNTGAVTGKVIFAGKVYAGFKAALNKEPATLAGERTINVTVPGTPAVVLALVLNENSGDITGSANGVAVSAKRNPWTLTSPATVYLGQTNLALNLGTGDVGNPLLPQGSSYGLLKITNLGVVTWSGKLADGTAVTAATSLSGSGAVQLHHALYAGTGSAQGTLTLAGDGSVFTADFDWYKIAQAAAVKTRSYKGGFARHMLEAQGSKYVKPVGVNVLGISGSTANAQAVFSQGGLSPASFTQLLNFPSTNALTISGGNLNTVAIKLDLPSGSFTGTYILPDPVKANVRTVPFSGILIPGISKGIGNFQLQQLPSPTTSDMLSGRVVIQGPSM